MSDVFISYSRLDRDFVGRLREALAAQDQDVWIDWESIPPSQAWWMEIQKGIAKANNFVVILSPNAMASPICHMEIEYARKLGKRIIPVLHLDYEREDAITSIASRLAYPEQDATRDLWGNRQPHDSVDANDSVLKHINYFFFRPEDDFDARFADLLEIIRTDYAHKEQHTTLELRAAEWDHRDRNVSFLLLDDELAGAQEWLQSAADKSPEPTQLQREYIAASEKRTRQLRNIRRASVIGSAVAAIAIIFAIIAFIIGLQANASARDAEDREARANIAAFTATAAQGAAQNQVATATRQVGTAIAQQATATVAQGMAQNQAATATRQVATAQQLVSALQEEATQIPPTLTQAAVVRQEAEDERTIFENFSSAMIVIASEPLGAMSLMDNLVEDYPDHPEAYAVRGIVYQTLEEFDEAIAAFDEAIERDPEHHVAYTNRGITYMHLGELDRALEDFNRAAELSSDWGVYAGRARVFAEMERYEEAIADYERAIESLPDAPDLYLNYGNALTHVERYEDALAAFEIAFFLDQQNAEIYASRGLALASLGNVQAALADYDRALELDPSNLETYVNRGNLYQALGLVLEAIADFDQAIELDPTLVEAYNGRGLAYGNLQEYEQAIQDYNRALELDPDNPVVLLNRSTAALPMGDIEFALQDLNQSIELDPTIPNAYLMRGMAYIMMEEYDAALEDWDTAEALGMQLPEIVENTRRELRGQ